MKKIILPLTIALAATATLAAQTTQKLTATKVNEYGLIYTLPNTVVDITIEAEKTVKQPGEFFQYAKKYLGLDPITQPETTYTLKGIVATPRGVADQEQRYLVQFKAGSTPFMMLNAADFPLAINTEQIPESEAPALPVAQEPKPTILQTPYAKQAVTAEMLQSPSSAKRAELAAARIYELRQNRNDIISGAADAMPSDGQAMKLALDNLAAQEAALTAMFIGTTQTSTQVRTYTVTPPEADGNSVVARLSVIDGLVDTDNLSGDPIYLDIRITERGTLPQNEKGETKRFPKGGFAYRIPGKAALTATFQGKTIMETAIEVAQYGVVFGLDPNLFTDKKAPAYGIFNPITGAITELGTVAP